MSHLQWNMKQLSTICHRLYHDYCPIPLKHRHSIALSKVSYESILVLLVSNLNAISIESVNSFLGVNSLKKVVSTVGQDN